LNLLNKSCMALLFFALPIQIATAAEPKRDFAIKTKSIGAKVSLDAKIKADAALALATWPLA